MAIADLESQSRINYAATAKKYHIDRTTLARRHRGETGIREEATSNRHKALTDLQEKALINRINTLNARGMPLTPHIVKNLAERAVTGLAWLQWKCLGITLDMTRRP